jgi:hypothetical protein
MASDRHTTPPAPSRPAARSSRHHFPAWAAAVLLLTIAALTRTRRHRIRATTPAPIQLHLHRAHRSGATANITAATPPPRGIPLSTTDLQALRRTTSDLSDLDPRTLDRAHAGFRHAYTTARRITDGTLDPLTA